jgi:cobalt-precorrin-7 (C5)-methyltransferase
MAKLHIVGTGPGSPDYVTPAAKKVVQQAQLVIGAERSLSLFCNDIKGKTIALTAKNVDEVLKQAVETVKGGKTVALLSTGDPGFSGLLGSVLRRSIGKSVEVNVVPGISSIQACTAKLCLSWDDAVLFAFHDDTSVEKKRELAEAVKAGKTVLLLPDPKAFGPNEIANYLIKAGVNKDTRIIVCENLTLADEKIGETTLEGATKQSLASLCVIVVKSNLKE